MPTTRRRLLLQQDLLLKRQTTAILLQRLLLLLLLLRRWEVFSIWRRCAASEGKSRPADWNQLEAEGPVVVGGGVHEGGGKAGGWCVEGL